MLRTSKQTDILTYRNIIIIHIDNDQSEQIRSSVFASLMLLLCWQSLDRNCHLENELNLQGNDSYIVEIGYLQAIHNSLNVVWMGVPFSILFLLCKCWNTLSPILNLTADAWKTTMACVSAYVYKTVACSWQNVTASYLLVCQFETLHNWRMLSNWNL